METMGKDVAAVRVLEAMETLGIEGVLRLCATACVYEAKGDGRHDQEWVAGRWERVAENINKAAATVVRNRSIVRALLASSV